MGEPQAMQRKVLSREWVVFAQHRELGMCLAESCHFLAVTLNPLGTQHSLCIREVEAGRWQALRC